MPFIGSHLIGRLLVHEWGHYRWGLFDEYPDAITEPDIDETFFFSSITNKFQGIGYAFTLKWIRFIYTLQLFGHGQAFSDEKAATLKTRTNKIPQPHFYVYVPPYLTGVSPSKLINISPLSEGTLVDN